MEPLDRQAAARRRRGARPRAAQAALPQPPLRAPVARPAVELGHAAVPLPPGSRRLGPVQPGDQGISRFERRHAERAMARLLAARGVDMVAFHDSESGTYELRSRSGWIRWERWATPGGELRYRIVAQAGPSPLPSVDGTVLRTLEQEVAAAGGPGRPVRTGRNSYPDMLTRITQLFDHGRAPEFVYIPAPGADPNHPGAGSHGVPDMVQSRAPLVIAGPGIARGAVSDLLVRHEDVAPTVADLLGVRPVPGTNASGVTRPQLLRWQDGRSLVGALAGGRAGAALRGSAERAIVLAIDGMSQTALLDEIRRGNLPNMARVMAAGTVFRNGSLASYPTVTWSNHNTIVTGTSPGHSGLVNNSWWDRPTRRERLLTDGGIRNSLRTSGLMNPAVETLYEAVERSFPGARTVAVNQPSGRGADISVLDLTGLPTIVRSLGRIVVNMLRNGSLTDREMQDSSPAWKRHTFQDGFATALGQALWSKADPPKLGVFEYTLVDNQGHEFGPHDEVARRALRQVDRQVGALLDSLQRRGIADSTAIVLTSDHGMEHQETDRRLLGGWKRALATAAAADGVRTVDSTRFVYVRSMRWLVEGAVPRAGQGGALTLRITDDDEGQDGRRPPVAGARVVVRDGSGGEWHGVSDGAGRVQVQVAPGHGPLRVTISHGDYSVERASIPLAAG